MKKILLSAFISLICSSIAFAEVDGPSVIQRDKIGTFRFTGNPKEAAIFWNVSDADKVDVFVHEDEGSCHVVGRPGKYRLIVQIVRTVEGRIRGKQVVKEFEVKEGDSPLPPPEPPMPPPPKPPEPKPPEPKPPEPPAPTSEFSKKLQAAYAADTSPIKARRGYLLNLAGFYEGVADSDDLKKGMFETLDVMLAFLRKERESFCPDSALRGVRTVISEYMAEAFGSSPGTKMNEALYRKAKEVFLEISKTLLEVK